MAIPNDLNINTEVIEKVNKYRDLEIEISKVWKVRTKNCASYVWSIRHN
jgi:hypothetical protein